jgi:predicted DNA-binding transcriptional regulator AlpA
MAASQKKVIITTTPPRRHHIDRRANALATVIGEAQDEALSTPETARLLGCSVQWLEIARSRGFGPRFTRLSPRMIRYLRSDLICWLRERAHHSTSEYDRERRNSA